MGITQPGTHANSVLSSPSCVALEMSLHLSEPQLPYLLMILPVTDAGVKGDEKSSRRRCWVDGRQSIGLFSPGVGSLSIPRLSPPLPLFRPRLGQMVGAGKCSGATRWSILRGLLFPFLLGAMWWPWVSADRMGSAKLPLPFPSLWSEPHEPPYPGSQFRQYSPTQPR